MIKKIENEFLNSIDLRDENGSIWGAVFVSTSKELGKRDIILMDEESGTCSARSITELIHRKTKGTRIFSRKVTHIRTRLFKII